MFTYYLRSREVRSFESLQELLIADRLKQLMPNDLRSLVTQQEVKGWLKPEDIAELAANFEESLDGSRQSNYRGTPLRNQHYRPQRTLEEPPRSEHQGPNTEDEANTSLEGEREGEQDAQALEPLATSSMSGLEQGQLESQNSVGEDIIEDSEWLGLVTEISSAEEQRRDESLADAWLQAKEGSHGMVNDGQLLYHREQLDGNIEMAPQAVKFCGQVSAAAQASELSPRQREEPSGVLHEYKEEMTAPDPSKPFCLATDALETAIEACLSQRMADTERPVAFLSKKLSPSQQEWSTIEREAVAIVWALEFLGTWLFGTKVKIRTDHDPLTFLTRAAPSKLGRFEAVWYCSSFIAVNCPLPLSRRSTIEVRLAPVAEVSLMPSLDQTGVACLFRATARFRGFKVKASRGWQNRRARSHADREMSCPAPAARRPRNPTSPFTAVAEFEPPQGSAMDLAPAPQLISLCAFESTPHKPDVATTMHGKARIPDTKDQLRRRWQSRAVRGCLRPTICCRVPATRYLHSRAAPWTAVAEVDPRAPVTTGFQSDLVNMAQLMSLRSFQSSSRENSFISAQAEIGAASTASRLPLVTASEFRDDESGVADRASKKAWTQGPVAKLNRGWQKNAARGGLHTEMCFPVHASRHRQSRAPPKRTVAEVELPASTGRWPGLVPVAHLINLCTFESTPPGNLFRWAQAEIVVIPHASRRLTPVTTPEGLKEGSDARERVRR
ncbi:hypothetical protein HPB50_028043 [Hyalomma asiaticum]|nr:hypothetical protein HPB50_028043 [Hyalomma asiaticum]